MKSLFSEEALNYTTEGSALADEIHTAINGIIKMWVRGGYNIREIGLIAMLEANSIVLEEILRVQFEISRKITAESKARMIAKLDGNKENAAG